MWVHATLVWSAFEVFDRFVAPLDRSIRERYYEESKRFARLFGVTAEVVPESLVEFDTYLDGMVSGPALSVCDQARTLAAEVLHPSIHGLGWAAGVGQAVTAGLLPTRLREEYGLAWGMPERSLFRALCRSTRALLPVLPDRLRYWPHFLSARARVSSPGFRPHRT
jgi:uncharacterized protein (DUF2236 family)